MMNVFQSVILGIVEGITEFLPISSTGHLILTSSWMHLHGEVVDAFEVFIQLGAILAVVVLYRHRFSCLFQFQPNAMSPKNGFKGLRGISLLAVTSLPILIIGKLLEHTIKSHLFNPVVVALALGIGGIILILVERIQFRHHMTSIDQIGFKEALKIGFFQCAALCPGVSRAASTIVGGLFNGLQRTVAAEYSFLAAVPIMLIVCLKDLVGIWHQLSPSDLMMFGIGFVMAFLAALVAVKSFIQLLQRTSLAPFGIYRVILAVLFFILFRHGSL